MNGWLDAVGTHNRYSVGSVDQNAMHVVAEAMYGSILMAPVSDIDNCDYFLLVGTNPAVSAWNWLETVPGGWRRALERQRQGATIVVVDPVRTETADKADLHLAVRPGQDWALLLAMVKVILDEGLEHAAGLPRSRHRRGRAARRWSPRPTSTTWPRAATSRAQDRAGGKGFRGRTARDGGHPHRGVAACGRHHRRMARPRAQRDHRPDGPAGRTPVRTRLRRRAEAVRHGQAAAHKSRLRGRDMVAGAHALAELPDEITTPGPGQIRAMVINCGNPVVSGPDGAKLDAALAQLDLLVAIDFVQRESHRHAHWLLPAVHWLERDDLLAFTSNMHDEPYVQYGGGRSSRRRGHARSGGSSSTSRIAMRKPLFGAKGLNGFIKATRALARLTRRPGLEFTPHWIDRLLVATAESSTAASSNGATLWPIRTAWCSGRASSGTSGTRCEPTTRRCTPPRPNSWPAPASCSPNRDRRPRTAIRSSWRTGATGTR